MSEKTTYAIDHIVSTPGICGGKPRIDGSRMTVQFLSMFLDGSRTVDDLCEDYSLTPAQIHAAWSYYYDHKEEIDRSIEEAGKPYTRPDEAEHLKKLAAMQKRAAEA